MTTRQVLSSDGVRLVYDDIGPPGGVPAVLCHGLTMEGPQFHDTAEQLAGRGYRVLMPDLRGHGRSGVPATISADAFSLACFASDQRAVLDDAGIDRAHWIGNSLGGIIGLSLLPSGRLLSLTTYGTAYRIGLYGPLAQAWVRLGFLVLGPRLVARMMAFLVSRHRPTQDYVAARILASRPDVIAAIAGTVGRYDLRDLVSASQVPILFLDCRKDWLVGWAMGTTRRMARTLGGVTVVTLAQGGHCADLDDPRPFRAAVLDFIGSG
ncbi:MAG TPA: alpha/beta hydrolase [Hypericibacter adhaerens]|uniref:alpha/beta fold hydrolase n=1 Tax=Hypericibacter adhaerens TaxID=2602016 RepID=UPI002CD39FCD|nr:alpha/beta hydrolase [Hypericibacter adhaerens]HWA42948.1 alpha/beta hydrolase [Hypericibacter adhaerens]